MITPGKAGEDKPETWAWAGDQCTDLPDILRPVIKNLMTQAMAPIRAQYGE